MSTYPDSRRKYVHKTRTTNSHSVLSNSCNTEVCSTTLRRHSSRRKSDTNIVVRPLSRVLEQEVCLSHSLPICDSQGVAKTTTRFPVSYPEVHQPHPLVNVAGTQIIEAQTLAVSGKEQSEPRVIEQTGLYRKASSNIFGFKRAPKKLFSSDPDISTAENLKHSHHLVTHSDRCDCRADLSHLDITLESAKLQSKPTRIFNIFSTVLSASQYRRRRRQETPLVRKYSMDSQIIMKKKQLHARAVMLKPSKRVIKITSPGQRNTLCISGADTLGGLPDEEDSRSFNQKDILPSQDCHNTLCRRSSCPVICESEESDEGSNSKWDTVTSSNVSRRNSKACFTHGSDESSNSRSLASTSEESTDDESYFKKEQPEITRHFYVGSDPLDGFEDSETDRQASLLEGVTFIVDKSKAKNQEKLNSSDTSRRNSSSIKPQPGSSQSNQANNISNRRYSQRPIETKESEPATRRAAKARANKENGSAPDISQTNKEKKETGRETVKMILARTESRLSSSSLTEDEERFNKELDKQSQTSSADESAS